MRAAWRKGGFVLGYVWAGLSCAFGAIVCAVLRLMPISALQRERWTRRMIHRLCAGLVGYLRFAGVLEVDFDRLSALAARRGIIIAANHPTFIDAILIMSQVPNVFCLTKAGVLRNPWVAGMCRCAGYEINSDAGHLIEHCAARLRRGENLLVFPEGTRTSDPILGRFKRGFAVMSTRTPAPVATVLIASLNGAYLRKGQSFFALPPTLPLRYRFSISEEFLLESDETSREFGLRIENHFRAALPLSA